MNSKHRSITALISLLLTLALFIPVFADGEPADTVDPMITEDAVYDAAEETAENTEADEAACEDVKTEDPEAAGEDAMPEVTAETSESADAADEAVTKLENGIELNGVRYIAKGNGEIYMDEEGILRQSEAPNWELVSVTADKSIKGYKEGTLLSENDVQYMPFPEGTTVTFTYERFDEDYEVNFEDPSWEAEFDGAAITDVSK